MTDDALVDGVEAALLGGIRRSEADAWIASAVERLTGATVRRPLFRAGRIDSVYGLETDDDRRLLLKVHRPPVNLNVRRATAAAQRVLAVAGVPCAVPVAEPAAIDGRTVSIETILDGGRPANGHDPDVRAEIASTLAGQMRLLAGHPDLIAVGRHAPAWCRYEQGPWPTPHDAFFDFRITPGGWEWLDQLAQRSSSQILSCAAAADQPVVCHADWYCGNLRFDGSRLAACFDWDLMTGSVAVLAGLTAGFHTHGTTEGAEQAEPEEVAAFLVAFEEAYDTTFDAAQQRVAAAAATWSVCYAARCQLQMLTGDAAPGSPLDALQRHGDEYLAVRW